MYQRRWTPKNSWRWTERLPETCRLVIPIELEFSASVGFIHKDSVTMHGHTILKNLMFCGFVKYSKIRCHHSTSFPPVRSLFPYLLILFRFKHDHKESALILIRESDSSRVGWRDVFVLRHIHRWYNYCTVLSPSVVKVYILHHLLFSCHVHDSLLCLTDFNYSE
jgi:hypothetical protein